MTIPPPERRIDTPPPLPKSSYGHPGHLPPTASPPEKQEQEPPQVKYARQTRNAVVFLAWVVGALVVLGLIGVILTTVELSHVSHELQNGGGGSSSNCLSQGGTDPSC